MQGWMRSFWYAKAGGVLKHPPPCTTTLKIATTTIVISMVNKVTVGISLWVVGLDQHGVILVTTMTLRIAVMMTIDPSALYILRKLTRLML